MARPPSPGSGSSTDEAPTHFAMLEEGFSLHELRVEPARNRIERDGQSLRVEPKVMRVLLTLARSRGSVLRKPELLDAVWGDSDVGEEVLTRCVSELRRALGDEPRSPRFVETIYKSGYRLLVQPTAIGSSRNRSEPAAGPQPARAPAPNPSSTASPQGPGQGAGVAWPWVAVSLVVLVAVLALARGRQVEPVTREAASSRRPNTVTAFDEADVVPVTTYPGHEYGSYFSPDGTKVAMVWEGPEGGDNYDIYVKRLDQDEPMRLTSSPAYEDDPAWAPDGEHIAFAHSGAGSANGIYLQPLIGGAERRLVDESFVGIDGLSFAPDGHALVFSARKRVGEPWRLYRVFLESLEVEALSEPIAGTGGDHRPAWSPDGKYIAFERVAGPGGDEDLHVVELGKAGPRGGNAVRRLRADRRYIGGASWLPDSSGLIYAANRSGYSQLWHVDLQGGVHLLSGSLNRLMMPSVSPNGEQLAFTRKVVEHNIWRYSLTDRANPQRLIASTRLDLSPAFSPDGSNIAFVSYRSGHSELWIGDRQGRNLRQVTRQEGPRLRFPSWSPQGDRLVVEVTDVDRQDLLIVHVDTGLEEPVGEPGPWRTIGRWSLDGQHLYFASEVNGEWQIWRQASAGGEAEQVTREGGFASAVTERGLFYTKQGQDGLWLRDGAADRLITEHVIAYRYAQWQYHQGAIYYLDRSRPARLQRLDLDDGTLTEVFATGPLGWDEQAFSIDPRGELVVIGQSDRVESDIWSVRLDRRQPS